MSKREYESFRFRRSDTPKYRNRDVAGAKYEWCASDPVYPEVLIAIDAGRPLNSIRAELGVPYRAIREMAEQSMGRDGYLLWRASRKTSTARANIAVAHANYRQLSPVEKADVLAARFRTHKLESTLSHALRAAGFSLEMNRWQAVPVGGKWVPREADIKVDLGAGRKVVIMCDGEAFHGPRAVFGDPGERMLNDVATAAAYFSVGYSVIRYSESEIRSGWASQHFLELAPELSRGKLLRNWF